MSADSRYLDAAQDLGMRLCREAVWSGEECNWTGDSMEFLDSQWQVVSRPCGADLYAGTPGIALFLAQLYAYTKTDVFQQTAIGGLAHAVAQLGSFGSVANFGFYFGLTGFAYVAVEAGEIFGDESLVQLGLEVLEKVHSREVSREQSWDVVSGSAGVIPVLLKLHARYRKPFLFDAALRHGERILETANRSEGWSWKTVPGPTMKNLTGFSHGAAGIAWALLELHHQVHEQQFLHAAQEALRYEHRWFDPQKENWPDFRSQDQAGSLVYAAAWCHGAPGIGLSRLRCYQLLQDRGCLAEAQAALRTTSKFLSMAMATGQGNYCLCHGNCGNAELLIAAADLLQDSESLKTVHQMADGALEKYHLGGNPWPCGVLNGGETPNLMLGLAGIGYFFLRLYDRKAPSVLLVGPK